VSVSITSRGQSAVISGDIFHHPFQFAEPALPSALCIDSKLACQTRRALFSRYEDRKALLVGTHVPDPTVDGLSGTCKTSAFGLIDRVVSPRSKTRSVWATWKPSSASRTV
jgi:glyoxylase-like metal-dependent hydrolase (beta-lactamase superfamily II)